MLYSAKKTVYNIFPENRGVEFLKVNKIKN